MTFWERTSFIRQPRRLFAVSAGHTRQNFALYERLEGRNVTGMRTKIPRKELEDLFNEVGIKNDWSLLGTFVRRIIFIHVQCNLKYILLISGIDYISLTTVINIHRVARINLPIRVAKRKTLIRYKILWMRQPRVTISDGKDEKKSTLSCDRKGSAFVLSWLKIEQKDFHWSYKCDKSNLCNI